MARPIGATPTLTGHKAITFIAMIHEESKKPIGLTPTPKLGKAHELILQHAQNRQK